MTTKITKKQIDAIRNDFIDGKKVRAIDLAVKINCDRSTILNYRSMFQVIQNQYPQRLNDFSFNLPIKKIKEKNFELDRANELFIYLPVIVDEYKSNFGMKPTPLYRIYKTKVDYPYSYRIFTLRYWKWKRENNICSYHHLRVRSLSKADREVLIIWRKFSNDARKFKIAVAILESYNGRTIKEISRIIDKPVDKIIEWFNDYRSFGIPDIGPKKFNFSDEKKAKFKTKQDNLIKLVHQSPLNFGINRATWRLRDLAKVYQEEYGEYIAATTVRTNLAIREYGFKKSRESLTSNDPKFREKLDYIKSILTNLGTDEKFFSVDEYGHFAVKLKGGRSIMQKTTNKVIPQVQISKGVILVTAALELSTNQVTHFYSRKKDSAEMIKLINLLCEQYKGNKTLYISWDAAAWHNSKLLKEHLELVNSQNFQLKYGTPSVKLAPLPSSAQFLNVIESVFSGLARAVIHNSDYDCVEDCQTAIDRHFKERNTYFNANPKHAGKLIWGKELVKPIFDEHNNCDKKK